MTLYRKQLLNGSHMNVKYHDLDKADHAMISHKLQRPGIVRSLGEMLHDILNDRS